jgi:1-acyl-sn-glycerol-3-phosphate acyltransferase
MRKFKKVFFQFWFWLFGWKVVGKAPSLKKYVIVVAPHTSNVDFFVGLAAKHIIDLRSHFLAKHSLFKIPLVGPFLKSIGGHEVDRSKHNSLVDAVVDLFNTNERFAMTVTPEGTRSYVKRWRTGFYHIAEKAGVPIVMIGFDYGTKTVEVKEPFLPSGDRDKDFEKMKEYFRSIKGRHPEKGVR